MNANYYLDWWTAIDHLPDMLAAAGMTMLLTLSVFLIEIVVSAFLGYIRCGKHGILYYIVTIYVELIRNTPLLVQIYIVYFGLPQLGLSLNKYVASYIALILYPLLQEKSSFFWNFIPLLFYFTISYQKL